MCNFQQAGRNTDVDWRWEVPSLEQLQAATIVQCEQTSRGTVQLRLMLLHEHGRLVVIESESIPEATLGLGMSQQQHSQEWSGLGTWNHSTRWLQQCCCPNRTHSSCSFSCRPRGCTSLISAEEHPLEALRFSVGRLALPSLRGCQQLWPLSAYTRY